MTFLQGEKIKLVKFTSRFITAQYIDWLNNQGVNKFLYTGRMPISKEEISERNDHCNLMFAIMCNLAYNFENDEYEELEDYNQYIGTISLNAIDWINRKGEVGYMIGEETHWGLGIATEAVKLVTDYALQRLNLNKVEAGVVDENGGSIKVLERNGFKEYGVIPQDYWHEGKYHDTYRFYKLQEW